MIGCIKSLVKFTANIVAALGLVVLAFGFYVLYQQVGLKYSDLYYNSADWLKTLQEYGFIIIGLLIFITGCAGIYSSRKKKASCKRPCLLIYQIGVITFFALCASLAIFTLIYSKDVFGKDCKEIDFFKDVDEQLTAANTLFCSDACQCYIEDDVYNAHKTEFANAKRSSNKDFPIQVQKCEAFKEEDYAAAAQVMQAAETLLHCTGWCESTPYYIFSDINWQDQNGNSCYQETKEFVESTGKILGYVLLGLAVLFLINIILVLCLCFLKDKKKKKRGPGDYQLFEQ